MKVHCVGRLACWRGRLGFVARRSTWWDEVDCRKCMNNMLHYLMTDGKNELDWWYVEAVSLYWRLKK